MKRIILANTFLISLFIIGCGPKLRPQTVFRFEAGPLVRSTPLSLTSYIFKNTKNNNFLTLIYKKRHRPLCYCSLNNQTVKDCSFNEQDEYGIF